jgi:hypothetical protein
MWTAIADWVKAKVNPTIKFHKSLMAFLRLSRAGFHISHSKSEKVRGFEIYRFYWNGTVIKDMPDIDCIDSNQYNTIRQGHVEKLTDTKS